MVFQDVLNFSYRIGIRQALPFEWVKKYPIHVKPPSNIQHRALRPCLNSYFAGGELMRDIQQVLASWGAWVADNREDVYWSPVATEFKGLIPLKIKSKPQCCEDDAMIISSCMAKLNQKNSDIHDLLFEYYVFGKTFIQLAYQHNCSDTHIGKKLQKAEGVIEGMLMMLNIKLEMDPDVQK